MNTWKVIVSALIIFIAGVVTGGLLVTNAMRVQQLVEQSTKPKPARPSGAMNGQPTNPWTVRSRELLRRMDRDLELSPEQHQRIEQIITASEDRTRYLWKPIVPMMSKETQFVRAEIRGELTPDQQKKFDELIRRPGQEKRHPGTNAMPEDSTNSPPLDASFTNAPAK